MNLKEKEYRVQGWEWEAVNKKFPEDIDKKIYSDSDMFLCEDVKEAIIEDKIKFQICFDDIMKYLFKQPNISQQQSMDISIRLAAYIVLKEEDTFGDFEK